MESTAKDKGTKSQAEIETTIASLQKAAAASNTNDKLGTKLSTIGDSKSVSQNTNPPQYHMPSGYKESCTWAQQKFSETQTKELPLITPLKKNNEPAQPPPLRVDGKLSEHENEAAAALQNNIDPDFTRLVWRKLEEQNPAFFIAYNFRLRIKEQITAFNYLVSQQAQVMQKNGYFQVRKPGPAAIQHTVVKQTVPPPQPPPPPPPAETPKKRGRAGGPKKPRQSKAVKTQQQAQASNPQPPPPPPPSVTPQPLIPQQPRSLQPPSLAFNAILPSAPIPLSLNLQAPPPPPPNNSTTPATSTTELDTNAFFET